MTNPAVYEAARSLIQGEARLRWMLITGLVLLGVADLLVLNLVAVPRYLETAEETESPSATEPLAAAEPLPDPQPVPEAEASPVALSGQAEDPAPLPSGGQEPEAEPEPEPEPAPIEAVRPSAPPPVVPDLHYGTSSVEISDRGRSNLDDVVVRMSSRPELRVLLRGHSDSRGDESHNLGLSRQRAVAAAAYLQENGISSDRIEVLGVGESRPADGGNTPESMARNRRVEVIWR
jgi:OOP family OmpA-OmpF porin